jgi:DNA-binding transcriptional LysR family regulator
MNRDQIKLSQLRALVAVAEVGNFSEAGLRLDVSQSAVSHAIASLENDLGVILFSRGRHGATLTPVGERILHHAQQMLQLLDCIDKEAVLSKGLQGGELRIASFRSVATHVLPEVIAQFRNLYPAIAISLEEYRNEDSVEQILREGRADIGFTCLPPGEEFETWELIRDDYIVLLPPQYRDVEDPISWETLHRFPLIMPPKSDYCSTIIRSFFARTHQSLKAAYHISEDSTIVSMVRQGLGTTIIARLAAEPLPPDIQVRCLPGPLQRVIVAAILKDGLHPPPVFAFLEALKSAAILPYGKLGRVPETEKV